MALMNALIRSTCAGIYAAIAYKTAMTTARSDIGAGGRFIE